MNKALLDALKKHYARIYGNETEETKEIAEANKAFEEELEKHDFDFTTYNNIDCKASKVAAEHRFKGFIDGYSFCLTMLGMNGES